MKTSLVITVFNEEKTIDRLLNSLAKQTEKPEEIIFVDGGSNDKTVQKIKAFKSLKSLPRVIISKGATIAQGRNRGIKEANGEIIAMTDAGCEVHPDWFEKIIKPFNKKEVDIAAGFYRMTGDSIFQKCLACYLGILPEKLDPKNFLPSARSIAFKKEIWVKVGGFNEKLERCGEDTLFNYQAQQKGAKFLTVKEALVDWEMPKTLKQAFQKFYNYAQGDGQINIKPHNLKIMAIYCRYLLGILLFLFGLFMPPLWSILALLITFYYFWAILKNFRYLKALPALILLPTLQLISDLGVMAGFARGSLRRK